MLNEIVKSICNFCTLLESGDILSVLCSPLLCLTDTEEGIRVNILMSNQTTVLRK